MLSQLSISLLAMAMTFASPLLHYWEHAAGATAHRVSDCCDACHDAVPCESPDAPDGHRTCDCKYRVAVPQVEPSDIAELATRHLPGDDFLASLDASDDNSEFSLGPCYGAPVHFLPAADGGELCARLGRYLL